MEGSTGSSSLTTADQPSRPGLFELRLSKPFTLCLVVIALLAAICVVY
jgi:hypothetical protein